MLNTLRRWATIAIAVLFVAAVLVALFDQELAFRTAHAVIGHIFGTLLGILSPFVGPVLLLFGLWVAIRKLLSLGGGKRK
jgi:hypothetical protein